MNKNKFRGEMPILPFPEPEQVPKQNDFHTLFSEYRDGESVEITPSYTKYTMYLTDFGETSNKLHEMYNVLRKATDNDLLEVRIGSNGGYLTEGEILHNLIKEKFFGRCSTVLDSHGYSMGALAFCMGDERVIYESSSIMFHNYSGGYGGKGNEIKSQYEYSEKQIKSFFESIIIGLSDEEIKQMYKGEDFWFDAKKMCKREIATDVIVGDVYIPAEDYLELLKTLKNRIKSEGLDKKIKTLSEAYSVYGIDIVGEYLEERNKALEYESLNNSKEQLEEQLKLIEAKQKELDNS